MMGKITRKTLTHTWMEGRTVFMLADDPLSMSSIVRMLNFFHMATGFFIVTITYHPAPKQNNKDSSKFRQIWPGFTTQLWRKHV